MDNNHDIPRGILEAEVVKVLSRRGLLQRIINGLSVEKAEALSERVQRLVVERHQLEEKAATEQAARADMLKDIHAQMKALGISAEALVEHMSPKRGRPLKQSLLEID